MADYYTLFSTQISDLTPTEKIWLEANFTLLEQQADESGDDLQYQYAFHPDHSLWLYSEAAGDPAQVAELIQTFFAACRPKAYQVFNFACTCSKLRLDSFSGGSILITSEQMEYINPEEIARQRLVATGKIKS